MIHETLKLVSNDLMGAHSARVIGYFLHNLWRVSISIRWYLYIAIRAYWGGTSVGNVPTRTISPTLMAIIYDPRACLTSGFDAV